MKLGCVEVKGGCNWGMGMDHCLAKAEGRFGVVGSRWADERLGMIGRVGGTVNGDVVCVGSGFEYDGKWRCRRWW